MHRKMFGSTKRRIVSLLAFIALLVGGGATVPALLGSATAAPVSFGAGTVPGALVAIQSSSPRGNYLDANGVPHCLPAGPNSTAIWATGDYPDMSWHGTNPSCLFGTTTTVTAPTATLPIKRETNVTVNVDFDATKPITVTGLPAFRAGSPELWGDNTGSIADAAADIIVKRAATSVTTCPAATSTAIPPVSTSLDVPRDVGSTVQKFCVYPRHASASTSAWESKFLACQSYALNVWVYAP